MTCTTNAHRAISAAAGTGIHPHTSQYSHTLGRHSSLTLAQPTTRATAKLRPFSWGSFRAALISGYWQDHQRLGLLRQGMALTLPMMPGLDTRYPEQRGQLWRLELKQTARRVLLMGLLAAEVEDFRDLWGLVILGRLPKPKPLSLGQAAALVAVLSAVMALKMGQLAVREITSR